MKVEGHDRPAKKWDAEKSNGDLARHVRLDSFQINGAINKE